jgi:LuxR family maltose regulon positive regulatory protein
MTAPAAAADDATPHVVSTKIMPPRLHTGLLRREPLRALLDRGLPLTIISAPVGYGKTTLLRSWCVERRERVMWITLDSGDDDPVRLWAHVAAAADALDGGIARDAWGRLAARGIPLGTAIDELMNGLVAYGHPVTIVLDDLHTVQSEATLLSLKHALERLPSNTRLLLSTRSDPRISVARFRARGELVEVRARDLAFSVGEARDVMVREGVELSPDSLELLVARTEGWPAGLYLSALWLRRHPRPDEGVRTFAGSARQVAEYLVDEVLAALDPEIRSFLLRTSVLERFSPDLCDAVLGRENSAATLGEIAESNLFLVPLDARGNWYRYHHLFRDVLQLELSSDDAADLRRRAAEWCRAHALPEEAIEYARAAGDVTTVAELLLEHDQALIWSGRLRSFLRWVMGLPPDLLSEHPELLAETAVVSVLLGRPEMEVQRLLAAVERSRRERPEIWTDYATAIAEVTYAILLPGGDVASAVDHGGRAVDAARAGAEMLVPGTLSSLALAMFYAGDLGQTERLAREALQQPTTEVDIFAYAGSLGMLALVAAEQGRFESSEAWATEALTFVRTRFEAAVWQASLAQCALALVYSASGRLDDAERQALQAERLRRSSHPTIAHAHTLLVRALVRARRLRLAPARADLARAQAMLAEFADPGRLPELASAVAAEIASDRDEASRKRLVERPSPAEVAVLRCLADGLSRREIAEHLFISLNTVKTHIRELYRKLGATSRTEAVASARRLGILERESSQSPG